MKSAYELAMERLQQESGPTRALTGEQKAAIADIEKLYDAKVAETRVSYDGRIAAAASREEYQQLREELAAEIRRLEEKREHEKNKIWDQA